jgi:hypothetical protein
MNTVQVRLEQIERSMKNILGLQPLQGTVGGSSTEQDVSSDINLVSSPPCEESIPARPLNTAERTGDSAPIPFLFAFLSEFATPIWFSAKGIALVDGTNVDRLCDFLLQSLRMVQVGQFRVPTIYEIFYPFCKGEVLVLLEQALSGRDSLDTFHEHLLKRFIPARQLSQLRVERYERVQAHDESLASYIQSVREAALL